MSLGRTRYLLFPKSAGFGSQFCFQRRRSMLPKLLSGGTIEGDEGEADVSMESTSCTPIKSHTSGHG